MMRKHYMARQERRKRGLPAHHAARQARIGTAAYITYRTKLTYLTDLTYIAYLTYVTYFT